MNFLLPCNVNVLLRFSESLYSFYGLWENVQLQTKRKIPTQRGTVSTPPPPLPGKSGLDCCVTSTAYVGSDWSGRVNMNDLRRFPLLWAGLFKMTSPPVSAVKCWVTNSRLMLAEAENTTLHYYFFATPPLSPSYHPRQ